MLYAAYFNIVGNKICVVSYSDTCFIENDVNTLNSDMCWEDCSHVRGGNI